MCANSSALTLANLCRKRLRPSSSTMIGRLTSGWVTGRRNYLVGCFSLVRFFNAYGNRIPSAHRGVSYKGGYPSSPPCKTASTFVCLSWSQRCIRSAILRGQRRCGSLGSDIDRRDVVIRPRHPGKSSRYTSLLALDDRICMCLPLESNCAT